MANYYTQASFVFSLTTKQALFAIQVAECLEDIIFQQEKHKTHSSIFEFDVLEVAKLFASKSDNYEASNYELEFDIEIDSEGVWISHDEVINTDNASIFIQIILNYFRIDTYVFFGACTFCSKKHLDGFSGIAYFITKDEIKWQSTDSWGNQQKQLFEHR